MKRLTNLLLSMIGLSVSCAQSNVLSPSDFTVVFVDAIRKAGPTLRVDIVSELQVKSTAADGREMSSFLDNAYEAYKQDPAARDEVIQQYVLSIVEEFSTVKDKPDRATVVPVIKDRPWLAEVTQSVQDKTRKSMPSQVYEDLNPELVIVYAFDSPNSIRYLAPEVLDSLKLQRPQLRALACENLGRLLTEIKIRDLGGVYMVTAGGEYEASLLLIDKIWTGDSMRVSGEYVVAVPARDILLVTGSNDADGIVKLRQLVERASEKAVYPISKELFTRRNGRIERFTP